MMNSGIEGKGQMQQDDKVALVTGSARRIGAAIVRELHAAGYRVAIHCNRSRDEAEALATALNAGREGSAVVVTADLLDTDALPRLVDEVVTEFGRLDLLVNNASSFYPTPLGKISAKDWDDLVGSNLKAPLFLAQAALPQLRQHSGCIINLIDIHTRRPLPEHPVYLAAKAGLEMLTRSLARDLGPEIRVNGVAPGAILWPEAGVDEEDQRAIIAATPLQRCGNPEDIAAAVRYLADSGFVTGQVLAVDGGRGL